MIDGGKVYPKFHKADIRRWFVVALAIWELPHAVLSTLKAATGLSNQSLIDTISQLDRMGISVVKDAAVYRLTSWGPLLKSGEAVRDFIAEQGAIQQASMGQRIANLRHELGMTQVEFWKEVDVPQTAGSRYEVGTALPEEVLTRLRDRYSFTTD